MGSARSSSFSGRLGGRLAGPLDQAALQLAAQVLLEAPQLLAGDAVAAGIVGGQVGLGLGAQAQRAADALHVDAEHARALAPAERGDGQPGEVAQLGVRAVPQRGGDLLAQGIEVELQVRAGSLSGRALGDVLARGLGLGGAEEEALEHELEHAAVLRGLGERRRHRLLEVGSARSRGRARAPAKASSSSEVPSAMPSSRSSSANASSWPSKPPGPRSGIFA